MKIFDKSLNSGNSVNNSKGDVMRNSESSISSTVNKTSYKSILLFFGMVFFAIGLNAFYQNVYKDDCVGMCTVNMNAVYNSQGKSLKSEGSATYNQTMRSVKHKGTSYKKNKVFVIDYDTGFSLGSSKQFGAKIDEIKGAAIEGDIVVINITSPGGSALACASDYNKVVSLKQRKIKVVATVDYAALSCGYYLASGADIIIADTDAWVGNIGAVLSMPASSKGNEKVVIGSTRIKELLAGASVDTEEDIAKLKDVVKMSFNSFKNAVLEGRGSRIKDTDYPVVFSALPFSGERGVELGLVDLNSTSDDFLKSLHYDGYSITKLTYVLKKSIVQKLVTGESKLPEHVSSN